MPRGFPILSVRRQLCTYRHVKVGEVVPWLATGPVVGEQTQSVDGTDVDRDGKNDDGENRDEGATLVPDRRMTQREEERREAVGRDQKVQHRLRAW